MSWKDILKQSPVIMEVTMKYPSILKKEKEVFNSKDDIESLYYSKVVTIIKMLKHMRKEVNYENIKNELIMPIRPLVYGHHQEEFTQVELDEIINLNIRRYNKTNEIRSENRPLDIPPLGWFEINTGTNRWSKYFRYIPKELKEAFRKEFGPGVAPTISYEMLQDWINEQN